MQSQINFSLTVGAYFDHHLVRLNVAWCRKIFPSSPLLISDDLSPNSKRIESVADEYGCSYICSKINSGHFRGDMQAAINAIAFARANNCDVALKISQSLVLLSEDVPKRLQSCFSTDTLLALPPKCDEKSVNPRSKFRAKFPYMSDFVAIRSTVDPQLLVDGYTKQIRNSENSYQLLVETFWTEFASKHKTCNLDWLSEHKEKPCVYLRKAQNTPNDYSEASTRIGLIGVTYDLSEWPRRLGRAYRKV